MPARLKCRAGDRHAAVWNDCEDVENPAAPNDTEPQTNTTRGATRVREEPPAQYEVGHQYDDKSKVSRPIAESRKLECYLARDGCEDERGVPEPRIQ